VRKHLRRRKTARVLVGAVNDTAAMAALQAFREVGLERSVPSPDRMAVSSPGKR
jgi:ribose transport system substrate-binding protein